MKTAILLLALLATPNAQAAFPPATDHIADCENRWFLGQNFKDPDVRVLGFAYIDPEAGFTFEAHGDVALDAKGELVRKPDQLEGKARLIIRVGQNVNVACIGDETVTRLGLPAQSEFLKFYEDKRDPGEHAASWGSHLNAIGAYSEALRHLEPARQSGYKSDLLWFELGFAYNATGQLDKAIEVLEPAVAASPHNVQMIGELAYSHLHKREFKLAIELYTRALSSFLDGDTNRRVEFAYNLSQAYQADGDGKAAAEWMQKARDWHTQEDAATGK